MYIQTPTDRSGRRTTERRDGIRGRVRKVQPGYISRTLILGQAGSTKDGNNKESTMSGHQKHERVLSRALRHNNSVNNMITEDNVTTQDTEIMRSFYGFT